MLYKLSIKNIKKSVGDYAIYFFTLILGVSIFYIFNAIESQTIMINVSSSTRQIIKLMTNVLSGVSVFISFILGFLIIYASRFLIKRRNKEFGIYLTLGMSKRKISKILLIETLLIGVMSLLVGLTLGIVLSQFMSLLVANMFEADLTEFTFTFSKLAAIKTLIYFSIIYLIVMIFNTINISKCKLIDLIQSGKKSEQIKLKNPYLCTLIFIVSVSILSYSYYLVTAGVENIIDGFLIFKPIILGCVSTFMLFWSLSGLILKLFQKMKKTYYKELNSFTLRQISSKINTTVISMTLISLMLFVTICVLSSALSLKNSMTSNLKNLVPADLQITKTLDRSESETNKELIKDSKLLITETLNKLDFNVEKNLKDIVEFNTYFLEDIKLKDTLGKYYPEAQKEYPMLNFYEHEILIKLSDYNKIAKLFNLEELTLNENEYIVITDFDSWTKIRNNSLKLNTEINLLGKTYKSKYKETKYGFIFMMTGHSNTGIFIFPDNALTEDLRKENILIANYNTDDLESVETLISNLNKHDYYKNTVLHITTKISLYESSVGLGAMVTFIGLYLGIIFLISSAAILALKELSESSDNKSRYKTLRNLGASEKMINKALFRQISIFFLFPLIIAVIHSIFGIMFSNYILEVFGNEKLLSSIIMTSVFLIFIYGGYFLLTYFCSKKIISE